ncbi:acyl dehydratase [Pseudomonas sp. BT76 TE3572]|jgi:acyl dehydratase|uniref:MaoC family dehydratase n=1 Tax=unclassified Pseudomonas TaxID=196821 RepID=UPI000DAC4C89|nr:MULTISPECIES: MaoC family dehydratase [unclassified Pseudomonas]MBD9600333.1 MaoC family dehydratase [Pseudomonas sp. PDM10]MBV7510157.1 MaoC family dehydratase [Pseudomonas sp. PDM25]PZW97042.1 acyl dehydratase [Pseudomonas sp. 478]TCV54542.1 acyl dehydratase [Pseudomonas sp. 460]
MTIHSWEKLYLDDLSLGQQFESDSLRVHRASMLAFAQEFDPQPFHLDPEAAELSLFRGLAASGWNTAALTMKLLVESVPLADGIIGLSIELSWPTPTYPDDLLRLQCTVQAIEPSSSKPDRGVVTLFMETLNQNDKVVQRATGKLLVFRRPAPD